MNDITARMTAAQQAAADGRQARLLIADAIDAHRRGNAWRAHYAEQLAVIWVKFAVRQARLSLGLSFFGE